MICTQTRRAQPCCPLQRPSARSGHHPSPGPCEGPRLGQGDHLALAPAAPRSKETPRPRRRSPRDCPFLSKHAMLQAMDIAFIAVSSPSCATTFGVGVLTKEEQARCTMPGNLIPRWRVGTVWVFNMLTGLALPFHIYGIAEIDVQEYREKGMLPGESLPSPLLVPFLEWLYARYRNEGEVNPRTLPSTLEFEQEGRLQKTREPQCSH